MEEYPVSDFDEFLQRYPLCFPNTQTHPAIRFRGQSDGGWELDATLERALGSSCSVYQYYLKLIQISDEVSAHTGLNFQKSDEAYTAARSFFGNNGLGNLAVYARQHGFPSPLLDWTKSPYIAAYFAYRDRPQSENVAIYCFLEMSSESKTTRSSLPAIEEFQPRVGGVARHYSQQVVYTYCTRRVEGIEHFVPHVFSIDGHQDKLVKFLLPSAERESVFQKLRLMNINEFSLFGGVDSLFRHLAIRTFS